MATSKSTSSSSSSLVGLDEYMFDFEPYRDGKNPKHTKGCDSQTLNYVKRGRVEERRKKKFLDRVQKWLEDEITKIEGTVVLTVAPGHEASQNPSGFVHDIVKDVVAELRDVEKMTLIRTKTVPKQSTSSGVRYKATHEGTINVKDTVSNADHKTVVIVDDVWTSGSTLNVCRDVVMDKTTPKDVKLFAVGKTVEE